MLSKQNVLATLAGTLAMFILGYVIWGIATVSFFEGHTLMSGAMKGEDELNLGLIFVANLASVLAMSTLYGKWAGGHHSAGGGLHFGAWIGIFVGIGSGLLMYATTNLMDGTGYAVEAVLDIVFYAIIGMIIALVYKATAPKAA